MQGNEKVNLIVWCMLWSPIKCWFCESTFTSMSYCRIFWNSSKLYLLVQWILHAITKGCVTKFEPTRTMPISKFPCSWSACWFCEKYGHMCALSVLGKLWYEHWLMCSHVDMPFVLLHIWILLEYFHIQTFFHYDSFCICMEFSI